MTVRFPALSRVVHSFGSATAAPEWHAAASRIADERTRVEAELQSDPTLRVYGFTTMLGHLDGGAKSPDTAEAQLAAHLIGPQHIAPPALIQLLTASKIEQLHHGGSGISPTSYRALLARADAPAPSGPAVGAWSASYGSGDVVPAAWWVHDLRTNGDLVALNAGDTIALINGSFISSTVGIAALMSAIRTTADVLALAAVLARAPRDQAGESPSALRAAFRTATGERRKDSGAAQASVALRDTTVLLDSSAYALGAVGAALEQRLSAPSANPLFVWGDSGIDRGELSQSSFLDPILTYALTNQQQHFHLLLGALQRMVSHHSEAMQTGTSQRLVQPPKVLQALLEDASLEATLPHRFSGADSQGVEDQRDLSLLTAIRAHRIEARVTEAVEVTRLFLSDSPLAGELPRINATSQRLQEAILRDVLGSAPLPPGTMDTLRGVSAAALTW